MNGGFGNTIGGRLGQTATPGETDERRRAVLGVASIGARRDCTPEEAREVLDMLGLMEDAREMKATVKR